MGGRKGIKLQNIISWRMGHTLSTIIGTRIKGWLIRWWCFSLFVLKMYVTSSLLCRFSFTIFYQIRKGGVLRFIFMWFGQKFRCGSRYIISWIIQKTRNLTRLYQVFGGPLGKFMVASSNIGWGVTARLITLNSLQSQNNL